MWCNRSILLLDRRGAVQIGHSRPILSGCRLVCLWHLLWEQEKPRLESEHPDQFNGPLTERLCIGLQNQLDRLDSCTVLHFQNTFLRFKSDKYISGDNNVYL